MEARKGKRKYPSKKWKDSELIKMLNFIIIDPKSFEKPTAQIYYKKMLKEIQISATWNIVRWKMRYLKQKFKRAAELVYEDKDKIYNICPHFDLLYQIFADNQNTELVKVFESSNLYISEDSNSDSRTFIKTETPEPTLFEITYEKDLLTTTNSDDYGSALLSENLSSPSTSLATKVVSSSILQVSSNHVAVSPSTSPVNISNPRSVTSSIFLNSGISNLKLSQSEQTKYLETNFELERQKIDIEEYKIKRELDLEEMKLKQNFELRKLEIEKDERIAKYEIEMRYKYKTHNMDLN